MLMRTKFKYLFVLFLVGVYGTLDGAKEARAKDLDAVCCDNPRGDSPDESDFNHCSKCKKEFLGMPIPKIGVSGNILNRYCCPQNATSAKDCKLTYSGPDIAPAASRGACKKHSL